MRYVVWGARKPIAPAHTNKLCKTANIATTIVRREVTSTERMQSVPSDAGAFGEEKSARIINVRIRYTMEDMMASRSSTANLRVRYICYM